MKYRPLNILNIVGKGLEKVLINIMNHRVYSTDFMNNLYGFTQQKSSTDAAIVVKGSVEESLKAG